MRDVRETLEGFDYRRTVCADSVDRIALTSTFHEYANGSVLLDRLRLLVK